MKKHWVNRILEYVTSAPGPRKIHTSEKVTRKVLLSPVLPVECLSEHKNSSLQRKSITSWHETSTESL